MSETWYFKSDKGIVGPVSRTELEYLLAREGVDAATGISQSPTGPWRVRGKAEPAEQPRTAPSVVATPATVSAPADKQATAPAAGQSGPPPLTRRPLQRRPKVLATIAAIAVSLLLIALLLLWASHQQRGRGGIAGAGQEGTGRGAEGGNSESATDDSSPQAPPPPAPSETPSNSQAAGPIALAAADQPPDEKRITFVPLGGAGTATFFGATAVGTRFAYVVDRSGSMDGAPFAQATRELVSSVEDLNSKCDYYVVFFNEAPLAMFAPKVERSFVPASEESKSQLSQWVRGLDATGGTSPLAAVTQALALRPDALFLLTDGQFAPGEADAILAAATGVAAVHTVAIGVDADSIQLRRIADETGGTYRYVP